MSMKDQNCILPDLIYLDTLGDMTYLDPFSISKWNNEKIFELSSEEYYFCSINGERVNEQQEISAVIIGAVEDASYDFIYLNSGDHHCPFLCALISWKM